MNKQIEEAVEVLNRGGIIIFPTDTAFGIGCRMDNENAVKKLFEIRKRPEFQAVPVLVSDTQMLNEYVEDVPEKVLENLIKPYWPGALTIVLKAKSDKVPELVRGGGETIGLRMPNHPTILEIINRVKVPVLGPSANFHGGNTPYDFKDLDQELVSLVDYVIEGECFVKAASTVIDCTQTPWKILRQGAINANI
jgi:L-threonylcarbamoyladenylate synthase